MLEAETEVIFTTLTNRTIATRSAITLKEVFATDIPKGIKVYLHAEVSRWLAEDILGAPKFARLIEQGDSVKPIVKSFVRSLGLDYEFHREEFLSTLDNAVHFLENYLCRPQWTLEQFVFDKNETVPRDTLRARLEYVTDYGYFATIIERYIHRKGWNEIRSSDFRSLLRKIDNEIVRQHNPRELGVLAKPIYDFLLLCDAPFDRGIPVKPLLVFFDDKDLKIVAEYVERICHIRTREQLSLTELINIIADLYSVEAREPGVPSPSQTRPEEPELEFAIGKTDGSEDDAHQPGGDESEPPTEGAPHGEFIRVPDDSDNVVREKKNLALSLTYAGMRETQQPPSLVDLNTLMTEEQRERFIRKIFEKDDTYFSAIITALNKTRSWNEAALYLKQLFSIYRVDTSSDVVIEFSDIVHQRYSAESKNPS